MSITYRDGQPGDGKAISKLFCDSFVATFGHLYSGEDLAAFLCQKDAASVEAELADPGFAYRLAHEGRRLAGYAKLGPDELPVDKPPATLELYHLYVLEPWQGKGVAKTLMEWTMDEARRRGGAYLQLTVFIDNHRARRFYERFGFEEVGSYIYKVGNHEDDDRIMRVKL